MSDLAKMLLRDATCMEAWANGVGPYPETVKGVSAKHAERARAAADTLAARDAEIARLTAEVEKAYHEGRENGLSYHVHERDEFRADAEQCWLDSRARQALEGEA